MSCAKLAFRSPEQAQRTADIIQAQGLRSAATAPRRLYLCPECDMWHWTSRPVSYSGTPSVMLAPPPPAAKVAEPEPPPPPPPLPKPVPSPAPAKPAGPTPQEIHFDNLAKQMAKRRQDFEDTLAWIKDSLRVEVSRVLREGTEEAMIDLLVVADKIIGLPKRGRFDDPKVAELLRSRAADKRAWLTARGRG